MFTATDGAYVSVSLRDDTSPLTQQPSATSSPSSFFHGVYTKFKGLSLPIKALIVSGFLALFVGVIVAASIRKKASSISPSVCSWADYRLPTNVRPLNYSVVWSPPLSSGGSSFASGCTGTANGACTFTGTTDVDVLIVSASPCILVHSAGLAISRVSVGGVQTTWVEDKLNERLVVNVPGGGGVGVAVGSVIRLSFAFSAPLSTTNTGLYQSSYTNDTGGVVTMVATQFEATSARHAFVCFDEPALKANFTLVLDGSPTGYAALGNMPNVSTVVRSDGTSLRVTFATTPAMSTYLLALVCGPLVSYTLIAPPNPLAGRSFPLPVTGYAVNRGNNSQALVYAVQAAFTIIPYYESLFGVSFPLPKMDMAAIPDFAAGAMENWGLITYRETAMLATVGANSASELQRVVVVVAHELAHQWMGDIVTMAWWSALWLNEGFASYMEFLGTDAFAPGFGIRRQFQFSDTIRALRADAASDVQQLTQSVTSSALIEGQFSGITYSKGAALIFTVRSAMEELEKRSAGGRPNSFFIGINEYLTKYVFSNAEPTGLWSSLSDAAGVPALAAWAQSYELQPGFPLVQATWVDPGSGTSGEGSLTLTQSRFFASPASSSAATTTEAGRLYWVPLSFSSPGLSRVDGGLPAVVTAARDPTQAFTGASWGVKIPLSLSNDGWVKIGVNASLYGRVNYPSNLWAALLEAVATSAATGDSDSGSASFIPPTDRATLLDDYLTLAESTAFTSSSSSGGGITTSSGLKAVGATLAAGEVTYEVLTVLLSHINIFSGLLIPDVPLANADSLSVDPFSSSPASYGCYLNYTKWAYTALTPALNYVTWAAIPGETPLTTLLRSSLLATASSLGHPATLATAFNYWNAFVSTGTTIPVEVASIVLNTVGRWGTDDQWDKLLDFYYAAQDAASSRRYLTALTSSSE